MAMFNSYVKLPEGISWDNGGYWLMEPLLSHYYPTIIPLLSHYYPIINSLCVLGIYPLVNSYSYWTWPFIVDLPIKDGDCP